jgi:hypothetical protein
MASAAAILAQRFRAPALKILHRAGAALVATAAFATLPRSAPAAPLRAQIGGNAKDGLCCGDSGVALSRSGAQNPASRRRCMASAVDVSGALLSLLVAQILHAQVPFRWRCLKVALDTCAFSGAQILHAQVSLRGGFALLNGSRGTWATPMRAAFSALSAFTLPAARAFISATRPSAVHH